MPSTSTYVLKYKYMYLYVNFQYTNVLKYSNKKYKIDSKYMPSTCQVHSLLLVTVLQYILSLFFPLYMYILSSPPSFILSLSLPSPSYFSPPRLLLSLPLPSPSYFFPLPSFYLFPSLLFPTSFLLLSSIPFSSLPFSNLFSLPFSYLSSLENSQWMFYISQLLSTAIEVASSINLDNRPVLVHCSDGWDRTTQVVALSQILLDPFYRTIKGFQILVEREWLSFGHKFADRCGQGIEGEQSPIFLQWLDCIYQLLKQFPTAFEFNIN